MKAIILAAGLGSRLRPITDSVPKCMVPVNGIPIIDKQVENLLDSSFVEHDIYIVSGYKGNILRRHLAEKFPGVNVITNDRYNETNNMFSLYLAKRDLCGCEFLLMNGDVFFDSNIIAGMMTGDNVNKIACDCSGYIAESMKITVADGRITHISKAITEQEHYAVSIDIYRFSAIASEVMFNEIYDTIEVRKDENSWTEVALDKIFSKEKFIPYLINGRWIEIDNHEDLAYAERLFGTDGLPA